jgi:hypothetical protein
MIEDVGAQPHTTQLKPAQVLVAWHECSVKVCVPES